MKTKSPAAKLPVKGQVTKQTTVKGSFASYFMLKTFTHPNNGHVIYTMPQEKKKQSIRIPESRFILNGITPDLSILLIVLVAVLSLT